MIKLNESTPAEVADLEKEQAGTGEQVQKPVQFETAIEEAEKSAFDYLAGLLSYSSGSTAFLAVNPGSPDCMVFDIGQIQNQETACFPSPTYCFRSMGEFYSRERRYLQRIQMELLKQLPAGGAFRIPHFLKGTNIDLFRLSGTTPCFERIAPTEVSFNGRSFSSFLLTVYFDIVFSVGNRPAE